uniref:Reverse transcriptase domain-containing protein n=1 Tax=Tanacetum cinerariifolium TaxID=118510 RepID=A0A6L2P1E1_TANCI|nr:hypothetical protein [Tanacetum cinerariifolium]
MVRSIQFNSWPICNMKRYGFAVTEEPNELEFSTSYCYRVLASKKFEGGDIIEMVSGFLALVFDQKIKKLLLVTGQLANQLSLKGVTSYCLVSHIDADVDSFKRWCTSYTFDVGYGLLRDSEAADFSTLVPNALTIVLRQAKTKWIQAVEDKEVIISIGSTLEVLYFVIIVLVMNINSTCLGLKKKYHLNIKNDMSPRDKTNPVDIFTFVIGITGITVNGKNAYEPKGKFLDDLHKNDFSGTNGEDAIKHIEYFLKFFDPIDLPNVNQDKLRVVVFPISLVGDAWRWFDGIRGSITSWKLGSDEIKPTYEEPFDLEETDHDNEQDYEWYEALEDRELKEKALRNKAIVEGITDDDDESSYERQKRWNVNETQELSVCNIRRFEMIKYSFGDDEEYVAVKEDEYDDLTSTSKDACRAYQEIFRMMDEGWMLTRTE